MPENKEPAPKLEQQLAGIVEEPARKKIKIEFSLRYTVISISKATSAEKQALPYNKHNDEAFTMSLEANNDVPAFFPKRFDLTVSEHPTIGTVLDLVLGESGMIKHLQSHVKGTPSSPGAKGRWM